MGKWEHKNIEYVLPEEIEKRSFAIIAAELAERGIVLPAEQDMITRRVIHTSADFDYAQTMTYSENAVEIAKNLIKNGADIVTDTNMALAGINKKVLASFGGEAHCYMADAEVAAMAKERKMTGSGQHGAGIQTGKAGDLRSGKCTYGTDTDLRDDAGERLASGIRHRGSRGLRECGGRQGTDPSDGGALYYQPRKKGRQQRGSSHLQCIVV